MAQNNLARFKSLPELQIASEMYSQCFLSSARQYKLYKHQSSKHDSAVNQRKKSWVASVPDLVQMSKELIQDTSKDDDPQQSWLLARKTFFPANLEHDPTINKPGRKYRKNKKRHFTGKFERGHGHKSLSPIYWYKDSVFAPLLHRSFHSETDLHRKHEIRYLLWFP